MARTVEICRPHEGYVDSQVAVLRGAVEAEIDSKRYRCPCWTVLSTIETFLIEHIPLVFAHSHGRGNAWLAHLVCWLLFPNVK
jgi:hypothetical protein